MSAEKRDNVADLIDLHVASPLFTRAPSLPSESAASDNLIDTELPVLEQKLQTASGSRGTTSRRTSVDIEDILITIDDDDEPHFKPMQRSNSEEIFLDLCYSAEQTSLCKSLSSDNLEALIVLKNLDDVLNATLLESNKILNEIETEDVEECLQDLDNYLKALDSSDSSSVCNEEQSEESEETLRDKLRKIEVNYTRFLAASGVINRAYVDTEEDGGEPRRPLSACDASSRGELTRNAEGRATVGAIGRKSRWREMRLSSGRAAAGRDSDEDIDWGWLQDAARDVIMERQAHAAGDRCTGTVVVEPQRKASSSAEQAKEEPRATWLRNSMRRLRHFRLPSDAAAASGQQTVAETARMDALAVVTLRPVSAPSRLPPEASAGGRSRSRSRESRRSGVSHEPSGRARSSSASSRSRRARSISSSESSLASSVDTTPTATPTHTAPEAVNVAVASGRRSCEAGRHVDMPYADSPLGQWPHSLSSMMACLGCTLGLFNLSRFATLSIHFGANFILQFCMLSIVFGLPLYTLQLCLGQQLGAGVIDMWRISPLFQGVGVALLLTQALIGLYSVVGVSWMFVYFRDSFITKVDKYRWAEPFIYYRNNYQAPLNGTYKLSETVPDYFSGIVLQRHHLASGNAYGTIKFQLAFNLAVVWMIVFVSLSKGLRSYGKVIYVFILLPTLGMFVLSSKLLGLLPPGTVNLIFPETTWSEFFLNPRSWLAAAQETFLTWGLLGAAVMQIASHNKHKHLLQRDSSLVAVITFTILLLVAFLANTSVQILKAYGYNYTPSSFEKIPYYSFLRSVDDPLPPNIANTPVRYMMHSSYVLGEAVFTSSVHAASESGYQALRLATELMPATFACLGADQVSPFWAVLFYFIFIMFGIAQQLAIWHCVITGIMAIKAKVLKSWETTITFFSCACGFLLGLPMATELGIYVVYFFDYTIGGVWWIILVILLQIVAVFMVRGRPYSGDTVVTALFNHNNQPHCLLSWAPALLSFTWNVILPVGLMVLCITSFSNGRYGKELFTWHQNHNVEKYFPLYVRQFGSMLQLVPILCVPVIAIVQSYRYLNNGPSDILERIQLLYRPPIGEHMEDITIREQPTTNANNNNTSNANATITNEDPPPKYTPPPSYTTATGARIAKFLRQSIRRSVRRLANVLGESSNSAARQQQQPPPPDYNAVLVEMNSATLGNNDISITVTDTTNERVSTLERLRNLEPTSSALTAAEVASILRSSFRRSTIRPSNRTQIRNNEQDFSENGVASLSAENLVDAAAPIGETSLVLDYLPTNDDDDDCKNDSFPSVI